ncbi:MAG: DUF3857 domain-containing protein [Deltaproteobacteria bacterium]|nr:DUF3857 domain-containing protein [Deltaproteobacteria bacterium]
MQRILSCLSLLATFAGCGTLGSDAFPPPFVPAQPTAGDWPDVGAAVIEDVATLTYDVLVTENVAPRLVVVLDHRRRLKILSPAGLAEARVVLPMDGFSRVTRAVGRSVAADGDVTHMEENAFSILPQADVRTQASEVKQVVFTVPGAEVGGLVEYRYERVFTDPDYVPVWVFGGPLPVMRAELGIVTGAGVKVDYRYGRGESVVENLPLRRKLDDGRERWVFVERDLPAYYAEPDMPSYARLSPWIAAVVTSARHGSLKRRLQSWEDVAAKLSLQLEEVGGDAQSGSAKKRFMRVRAMLAGLDVPGLGVRRPVPAKELERGEAACTRDAAALLWRAMQGGSAKAYPAFLATASGPVVVKDLPGLYPFVRAVVAVDVSEEIAKDPSCKDDPARRGLLCTVPADSYAFLDPLCGSCRYGELATALTGGTALVLHPDGPRFVDVPLDPPERNRSVTQFRLALDIDGSLSGAMNGELTGAVARRVRGALAGVDGDDGRDQIATQAVLGEQPSVRLTQVKVTGETQVDEPVKLRAKAEGRLEKIDFEHYRLRAVELAGPALPGRWRTSRRHAALLEAPLWGEAVASVEVPVGYEMTLPALVKIVEPFAEYAAGFARRDRTLTYTRRLVVKVHRVDAADWPAFRRFLDRIEEAETTPIEIRLGNAEP